MFRRNKNENKAKLEHKLYLARENPEPIFDLTDCDLHSVPQGIYSLCRVFLKEVLRLEHNHLNSLSGGGNLRDLHLLKVLDISHNLFNSLPEDICFLKNLQEFYISNNKIKILPQSICILLNLKIFDVANNSLKQLPDNIGNLSKLRSLNIRGNKHLKYLPKSICKAQRIMTIELDGYNFEYPPKNIIEEGTNAIMRFICEDTGLPYILPEDLTDAPSEENKKETYNHKDPFQQQKLQEFLEIEKHNELMQRQEIELAHAQKANREKLLVDIAQQQSIFDSELNKIHQEREYEKFRLVEQLQGMEQNADIAIKQLLELNREPLTQLLEIEREEEQRLLAAASKYNEMLRKDDILAAMEIMLQQETEKFQQFHQSRIETSQSILEQEIESDCRLSEILQDQDDHKAELILKLQEDSDLQKAAVGTLLERADARSWGLSQQVRLVESQLAALTLIEMDRRKLEIDEHLNDLSEKRINLSILLMDLIEQQKERRNQLLSMLKIMEESRNSDDFWLKQYQNLLDKLPPGLLDAQKNMDPALVQTLLMYGVIHCLPFLAKLTQLHDEITNESLLEAGVLHENDRIRILDAFQMFNKEKEVNPQNVMPSAPILQVEEASAPLPDHINSSNASECVICLDTECQIIFVPCGHLCCCSTCSSSLLECPLCRSNIERKIRIELS